MPTEDMKERLPRTAFFKDQEENIKELASYESKQGNNDDAVDALKYAVEKQAKNVNSLEITLSRESSRRFQKMLGIEIISRKRFIKLLMGCRIQRNEAVELAKCVHRSNMSYSPIIIQVILEMILKTKEK